MDNQVMVSAENPGLATVSAGAAPAQGSMAPAPQPARRDLSEHRLHDFAMRAELFVKENDAFMVADKIVKRRGIQPGQIFHGHDYSPDDEDERRVAARRSAT